MLTLNLTPGRLEANHGPQYATHSVMWKHRLRIDFSKVGDISDPV